MKLNNKAYNAIKYLITVFLPAVGALYFLLAEIWGFENSSRVNGTINGIIVFLGLLIGYSTYKYNKATHDGIDGDLVIVQDEEGKYLGLAVNESIKAIESKTEVRLRVIQK